MQIWQKIKAKLKVVWEKNQNVIIFSLLGLTLLAGLGIGIHGWWPRPKDELVVVQSVSPEEMELVVQAQVEKVIAHLYPWVLEQPLQRAVVEPPTPPQPLPQEVKPTVPAVISLEEIVWPVLGNIQTPFGWYRHPVYGDWRFNAGLEFSASEQAVRTVLAGEVVSVTSTDLETELIIDHGGGWTSVYRSVKGLAVVPGQRVQREQEIAFADGGTVFFGLNHNDAPVNPQAFLR